MEVSVENTGSLERRLTVSVPEAQINEQCRTKMAELAKDVKLKGFRPGKIPNHILQQRFGKAVRAEVVGTIIQKSLEDALEQEKLQPAGMPTIEQIQDESGKALEYVAKFEIFPEIKLGDLSQVEIEKKKVDITEEDIQKTITKMCENMGKWEPVSRSSQRGDKLVIDLERRWTTQEEDLQKFEKIDFILDETKSLADLVNCLLDKNIEDEMECTITYPDTWHDQKLRGRESNFKVKIHEILEKKPLTVEELTEKLNLDKEDPNTLKEKIKERMEKEALKVIQDELKEKVLEILLEKNPIDKPKTLIEQEKKALKEEIAHQEKTGMFSEEMQADEIEELAEKRVVLGLLVNKVLDTHDIKVNNQRLRELIMEQAANFPDPKRFISYYYTNKELMQKAERLVLLDQAVEKIIEGMKIIEKPVRFEELMESSDNSKAN